MFKSRYALPLVYAILLPLAYLMELLYPETVKIFALVPGDPKHLMGIVTTVFIHKNLDHLTANSLTLMICLFGLAYFYREIAVKVILISHVLTGILIWIFARPAYHIGASGLVYALVLFVLVSGFTRSNKQLLVFAFVVLVFQSGLIWGMFPFDNEVSWESHLFGALTGIFLAVLFRKEGPQADKKLEWEEETVSEEDEYESL